MTQNIPEDHPEPIPDWMTQQPGEKPMTTRPIERDSSWLAALGLLLVLVLGALGLFFLASLANAQTPCAVGGATTCFDGDKTTGESPLTVALTWNVVGATSCTAGGAGTGTAWNGSIPCSGTRTLTGVTVKRTLTIDPIAPPTAGKMRLSWTPPTKNTDGSTLTNLGGYVISYGTAAGSLTNTIDLAVPAATSYDITGLTAGTWFAALQSATDKCFPTTLVDCRQSLPTAAVSRAVTTTPGGALPRLTLVIEPYQVPNPPSNIVVSDVTAFEISSNADGTLQAKAIDLVPLSTRCIANDCTVLARRQ